MKFKKIQAVRLACIWLFGVVIAATSSSAATYYVAKNGINTNPGTKTSPLLTIQAAATKTVAGDTVRVQPGLYEERLSISRSGSINAWINYVAEGNVICRGFDFSNAKFVRIIGFEITHKDLAFKRGMTFGGTSSFIDVVDNFIHDVNGAAIVSQSTGATNSYITIRGNTIDYIGRVANVASNVTVAISGCYVTPNHWLIEYNSFTRCGDFVNPFGTNNIVRNNSMRDYRNAYWNTTGSAWHSDMFQPGSDGTVVGTRHHVYERNFCGDSTEFDSHFGIWQDTVGAGDTNIIIRGNVAYNFGSGGIGVISMDKVNTYNNTFYKFCQGGDGALGIWYGRASPPIGGLFANTIIYDRGLSRDALNVQDGTNIFFAGNLGFMAGTEASYVSTNDPLFINIASSDFRINAGSPAIGAGTNFIRITSAAGTGTTFDINDGQLLIDGWGIVDGDIVTIAGTTTKVLSIVENSVTVANPVTWSTGTPVYWGSFGRADIGALPFGSTELTRAKLIQDGTNYTVNPTGDVRGIWFYVDGIPTIWDSEPPYAATIATGVVTAKAYALYAQANPVVLCTKGVTPPSNLRPQ
jgi:hypothetical protein